MTTDLRQLSRRILREYRLHLHGLHGPWHWLRVRANGMLLADATPKADRELIELFALLHDSQRWDEHSDPQHGLRAAAFTERLHADGVLLLDTERLQILVDACAGHTTERKSKHPTIGCCWDADRLELSRLGDRPDDTFMSTKASADPEIRRLAWERGQSRWEDDMTACRLGFADFEDAQ